MHKIALFTIAFVATPCFAGNIEYKEPQTLLTDSSIQQFEVADLNGDGLPEIIMLTANGEIKVSSQSSNLDDTTIEELKDTKWKIDDHYATFKFYGTDSVVIDITGRNGTGCSAFPIIATDNAIEGQLSGSIRVKIDSVTTTKMTGNIMCPFAGLNTFQPFIAYKVR
ncbi:hypothetical protein [Photobacterium galatheae]|uniref:VCBS repeat-containing protein n=1 Tax=Photobacterium galatheae TaxID=1654360 RepID=A0A066RMJ1_9GAMM|nr:hypothetical protein [Photobacterium galatheae]KDM91645.1 hypothetical protein EA58_11545 [Photobacterium galatheae]MCM0149720.1 hypothetical protein [Photobacterium galatheae]